MYLLGGTSFINDLRVPSATSATLLLSLLVSLLLLLIIRLAFFVLGSLSTALHPSEKQSTAQQTGHSVQPLPRRGLRDVLSSPSWSWRWDALPLSLPISFSFSDHEVFAGVVGKGVGVSPSVPQPPPPPPSPPLSPPLSPPPTMTTTTTTNVQVKSAGPAFEHPRQSFLFPFYLHPLMHIS
jgi:hypothetical protein